MAQASQGHWHIGTSGYQYSHWQGNFYPEDLPRSRWFKYYTQHFDSVEINNTFYRLPEAEVFDAWRQQAPQDFCYALKFSRYASHLKRLNNPDQTLDHFIQRAHRLVPLLGPILVQLPPRWNVNGARLASFLEAAPSAYRWAIEFRDRRWLCDEIYRILKAHNAALCIHDLITQHPRIITADWMYLRFHGQNYGGRYSSQFLSAEADRIQSCLAQGLDVFAYFNNDQEGFAVHNALALKRYVQSRL